MEPGLQYPGCPGLCVITYQDAVFFLLALERVLVAGFSFCFSNAARMARNSSRIRLATTAFIGTPAYKQGTLETPQ